MPICKTCGRQYHYCRSCGIIGPFDSWHYCSEDCYKNSENYKIETSIALTKIKELDLYDVVKVTEFISDYLIYEESNHPRLYREEIQQAWKERVEEMRNE